MNYLQLQQRTGKNILIFDDTNSWKVNRDVYQGDIKEFINDLYVNDIFPMFASQYAQDFRETGYTDNWTSNGTANMGLTGAILTSTTSIFTNSMVGLSVYQGTDATYQKIVTYNSSTSVVTDATDISSWSGKPIYVLGQEFGFAGDASDIFEIEAVSVKYSTSDAYYRIAQMVEKFDFYRDGGELGAQLAPQWYPTNLRVGGVWTTGFGLIPGHINYVPQGVKVDYIGIPPLMVNDSDVPRLRNIDNALIYGATSRAFRMMQQMELGDKWDMKYEKAKLEAIERYKPSAAFYPVRQRMPRSISRKARRLE